MHAVFYDGSSPSIGSNQISLTTSNFTSGGLAFIAIINHNGESYASVGDDDLIKLNFISNNAAGINLDFDTQTFDFNNGPDVAIGSITINL